MDKEEIRENVAATQDKIEVLQELSPETVSQKGSVSRYLKIAKSAVADLKSVQHALDESADISDSEKLEAQIRELRESLRIAAEVLFKELNTKLVNDAAIDVLEKTLLGLNILYQSLYGEDDD